MEDLPWCEAGAVLITLILDFIATLDIICCVPGRGETKPRDNNANGSIGDNKMQNKSDKKRPRADPRAGTDSEAPGRGACPLSDFPLVVLARSHAEGNFGRRRKRSRNGSQSTS